jgi:hypothetical protein
MAAPVARSTTLTRLTQRTRATQSRDWATRAPAKPLRVTCTTPTLRTRTASTPSKSDGRRTPRGPPVHRGARCHPSRREHQPAACIPQYWLPPAPRNCPRRKGGTKIKHSSPCLPRVVCDRLALRCLAVVTVAAAHWLVPRRHLPSAVSGQQRGQSPGCQQTPVPAQLTLNTAQLSNCCAC